MDELVYLFELDSVRNSPQEILRAQWAMFREVALKGNRVVLSFNQLTDSEGFLCGVRDPKLYPHLAALFEMGVLKYSRFAPGSYGKPVDDAALRRELSSCRSEHAPLFQAGVLKAYDPLPSRAPQRILRTASHYIQNGVDQCLSDTKGRFLFSALPFRSDNKRMLSAIHYALEYSDPSILDEVHHAAANLNTDGVGEKGETLKRERLDFAKTYVELILRLSREPLAANPPQLEPHPPMTEFLSRVLIRCEAAQPPQAFPLWPQLCRGAQVIGQLWPIVQERGALNQRSDWYAVLRTAQAKGWDVSSLCMAEAIVDLCYNYTIAESIQGLTRNFRDEELFWQDFLQRLPSYWKDGQQGVHKFLKPDSTAPALAPPAGRLPRWDTASRLVRHAPGWHQKEADAPAKGRKRGWGRYIALSLCRQIIIALFYGLLFLLVSRLLELPEDLFPNLGAQGHVNPHALTALSIVIFGVVGSFISWKFNLLDILEIFRQFGLSLWDGAVLLRAWLKNQG